jgi:hypothetical protein
VLALLKRVRLASGGLASVVLDGGGGFWHQSAVTFDRVGLTRLSGRRHPAAPRLSQFRIFTSCLAGRGGPTDLTYLWTGDLSAIVFTVRPGCWRPGMQACEAPAINWAAAALRRPSDRVGCRPTPAPTRGP